MPTCIMCGADGAVNYNGFMMCQNDKCGRRAVINHARTLAEPLSANSTLTEFIAKCHAITMGHIMAHGASWDIKEQLNKITEEYTELVQALAKHDRENIIEEAWDVMLATITLLTLYGFNPQQIRVGGLETLAKVQERIAKRLRAVI